MDKLLELGEFSQDIIKIIVVIGLVLYFGKHLREWLEYLNSKRFDDIDRLKVLSENISNTTYSNVYKKEQESSFFSLLTKREIFSSSKRKLLLDLLQKELITKRDIKKYSHNFHECKGKINIKISFFDHFDVWFPRFVSIYIITMIILTILQIEPTEINFIVYIASIIAILIAAVFYAISFKVKDLKTIIKKLKVANLYLDKCS